MKSKLLTIKLIVSLAMLLITTISIAQQGVNYQGVARDADQQLIADTEITLEININKTAAAGETVYTETHTVTTDTNGVFSVVIGQGITISTEFEDINWAEDKHYLNVWLNNVEIGTTEFKSVPYTQAMGKWQAHINGVMPVGTGNSIYIGEKAGENENLNSVNNNIGLGLFALQSNADGYNNIALGSETLKLNESGINNTAMGNRALSSNTTGNHNLAIGLDAMESNSTGSNNIAIGEQAMQNNEEGNDNVANGFSALNANTTGNNNSANGNSALLNNTSGNNNIASGFEALYSNTTGNDNIAHGFLSLHENTEGDGNIALGNRSLKLNTIGNGNIALGDNTLENNTSGGDNVAIGRFNLVNNQEGILNVSMGKYSLINNTDGSKNVAVGAKSMENHINGDFNVALGYGALWTNETGEDNIAIGRFAGMNHTGENSVFIGKFAGDYDTFHDMSNILIIDQGYDPSPLIYGEFDNSILSFGAKVGIGTREPTVPLNIQAANDASLNFGTGYFVIGQEEFKNLVFDTNEIQARNNGNASDLYLQNEGGNVRVGGAVVHASDARLKRDINDISYGLKDILKLRPTEYFWKGKEQEHKSLGLIAQEVDEVIKNVVTYDKEQDKYGVSYTELIPVLIKAIQEQEKAIKKLEEEVAELKLSTK